MSGATVSRLRPATLGGHCLHELSGGAAPLPLVSIILINHNYGAYIGQAIESIKRQDYLKLEVVVVDNASTDNSRSIIEANIKDDRRFSAIYSGTNDGPLGAAIKGFNRTRGEFVGFFDADDFLLKNCVSYHLQAHLAAPDEVAFTSANVLQATRDGSVISGGRGNISRQPQNGSRGLRPSYQVPMLPTVTPDDYEALSNSLVTIPATEKGWLWYGSSAMLLRRRAITMVLPQAPENLTIQEDGFFLSPDSFFACNCHWLGGSIKIEIPLHVYRIHGRNQFNRSIHFRGLRREKSPVQAFLHRRPVEVLRELLLRHERIVSQTSAKRFWQIFDQACERLDRPMKDRIGGHDFGFFVEAFPKLVNTFGARRTVLELGKRIGLRSLARVILSSYRGLVPPRVALAVISSAVSKRLHRARAPSGFI